MPRLVSTLSAAGITALCACVIGVSLGAAAQGRFVLLSGDAIAAAQGLSVYTIRDNQTAVCYTLFVLGSLNAESMSNTIRQPAVTAEDLDKIHVAETLKAAAAIRDRKIEELRSRTSESLQAEAERERIDDEYESAVRRVLPRLYPSARVSPEWRSTSSDALNDAVRQAIADAAAVAAGMARSSLDDQLLNLFARMTQSPRLAVSGPVACVMPSASAR